MIRFKSYKSRSFPSGFLFAFLFSLIILTFSSCNILSYKSEVTKETDLVMNNLKQGNFEYIPTLRNITKDLGKEETNELLSAFMAIENWTITVAPPIMNIVRSTVELKLDNKTKLINFDFKKIDGEWVLQENITFSEKIDFIAYEPVKE